MIARQSEAERLRREAALDETIEQSFPASDPPSTVPNPDHATEKTQKQIREVIEMAESTTDHSILKKIEGLVHEEQHLYGKGALADHDQVRLEAIKIELDQCWDLLRQRDARREFGQDPNQAKLRPAAVVERYEQ
jgi:uncharacterized protein DUF2630